MKGDSRGFLKRCIKLALRILLWAGGVCLFFALLYYNYEYNDDSRLFRMLIVSCFMIPLVPLVDPTIFSPQERERKDNENKEDRK